MEIRYITTILLLCLSFGLKAQTTYHVASDGSGDFTTIAQVNAGTFSAGDQILFKRGDTFYGTLTVNQSGTSGNPITYGAYGTGANPVITGFTTVSSWTNLGSNIWESSSAVSTLSTCNMVVINGVNTAMGRYPNTGWLTYQSYSTNTSITSSSLTGTPDWTGAEVVIKKFRYVIEKHPITSQSGGTLNYSGGGADGQNGWGFFIQNDARTLDAQNEWYYNPSTKKIRVYSTSSPTGVQVASLDNLVSLSGKNYIVFDGIDFTGANGDALSFDGTHITVQHCTLNNNYNGISGIGSSTDFTIDNNSFNHTNNNGININSGFQNATITNNVIKNTGVIVGMGGSGQSLWAMNLSGNNYTIQYNEVDSTGYVGIGFNGSNVTCDKNLVNYYCFVTDDGGGIYTGNPQTGVVISNNIVLNGIGADEGTGSSNNGKASGIYCDDNSSGMSLLNNSVSSAINAAIFLHNPTTPMTVRGNTTFNCAIGLLTDRDNMSAHTTGMSVHQNNFVGNNTGSRYSPQDQVAIWFKTAWSPTDIPSFGSIDSNYYSRPISNTNYIQGTVYGDADTYYDLASWQAYTSYDTHSQTTPITVADTSYLKFVYNATNSSAAKSLSYTYEDVTGTAYNGGSITLAPYSSAVLLQTGSLAAAPTISMSGDQSITVDTVNIYATATWASGHTGTYAWTKISGPGTTIIGSPASFSTTVSNLQTGTYDFRCTVSQDDGQTAYGDVIVTVNIPPVSNPGNNQTIRLAGNIRFKNSP